MDLYEQAQIYYAPQNLWQDDNRNSHEKILALFKRFIKEFKTNTLNFYYRDMLKSNLEKEMYYLEVLLDDLINWDNYLAKMLFDKPNETVAIVSYNLCFFS